MAAPFDDDELPVGDLGEGLAPFDVLAYVQLAMDHQRGDSEIAADTFDRLPIRKVDLESIVSGGEDRPGRLQCPRNGVFVLLCGMGLDELFTEEEFDPSAMLGGDGVTIVHLPATRGSRLSPPNEGRSRPNAAATCPDRESLDRWPRTRSPDRDSPRWPRPPTGWRGSGPPARPDLFRSTSRTATMSATLAALECDSGSAGRPDRPLPRPSKVMTR